jgi:hypothetical protein
LLRTEVNNANGAIDEPSRPGRNIVAVAGLPVRVALIHALLFAAAFCFYGALWSSAPAMEPDSGSYLRFAQDLSDFHIDQYHERTPGYPVLLLLTGSSQSPNRALFYVSLALHFASIWLLASVLWRAGLSGKKVTLFSLILLLPPFVEPAAYVLTETLAEAMLVAAFVSLVFWHLNKRPIWILISAATIGYSALTRPTYQVLAFAVAAWLVAACFLRPKSPGNWRNVVQGSLILIFGSILIVGGYAYFNYRHFGYFGTTYKLGISLTQKTVHVIERLPDEYASIREVLIRGRNANLLASRGTELGYISAIVPELTQLTGLDEPQLSKYLLKLNLLLIRKAPLNYLQDVVLAFGHYWFPTSTDFVNFHSRLLQTFWAVVHFILFGAFALNLILLFGAAIFLKMCNLFADQLDEINIGGAKLIDFQKFVYGLAGTIVFYTAAISCFIDVGDPRHRVPTDVIIVFMLFLGSHLWWRLVSLSRMVFERIHPT